MKTLGRLKHEKDQNLYLTEMFLVSQLPPIMRALASRHFFGRLGQLERGRKRSTATSILQITIFGIYFVGVLFYIFLFGIRYGSVSTNNWLINVGINVLLDIFVQSVMKLFVFSIVLPSFFLPDLHALHDHLKHKFNIIISRKRGLIQAGVDIIQYTNPTCRASRTFSGCTMAKVLLSVNDFDMPIVLQYDESNLFISFLKYLIFYGSLFIISIIVLSTTPILQDVIFELGATIFIPLAFLSFFFMWRVFYPLPIILSLILVSILMFGEWKSKRDRERIRLYAKSLDINPKQLYKSVIENKNIMQRLRDSLPVTKLKELLDIEPKNFAFSQSKKFSTKIIPVENNLSELYDRNQDKELNSGSSDIYQFGLSSNNEIFQYRRETESNKNKNVKDHLRHIQREVGLAVSAAHKIVTDISSHQSDVPATHHDIHGNIIVKQVEVKLSEFNSVKGVNQGQAEIHKLSRDQLHMISFDSSKYETTVEEDIPDALWDKSQNDGNSSYRNNFQTSSFSKKSEENISRFRNLDDQAFNFSRLESENSGTENLAVQNPYDDVNHAINKSNIDVIDASLSNFDAPSIFEHVSPDFHMKNEITEDKLNLEDLTT